jgi:hypothetical protein
MGRKARISGAAKILREQQLAEIIQLRLQGQTLQAIGESMQPPCSAQNIHTRIRKALQRMMTDAVEQARRLEELRCDELLAGGLYERGIGGDAQAAGAVVSVMQRRARLLGLGMQPLRSGADSHEQPLVKIEIVGGEEMAHAEQAARFALGRGPHLG